MVFVVLSQCTLDQGSRSCRPRDITLGEASFGRGFSFLLYPSLHPPFLSSSSGIILPIFFLKLKRGSREVPLVVRGSIDSVFLLTSYLAMHCLNGESSPPSHCQARKIWIVEWYGAVATLASRASAHAARQCSVPRIDAGF